MKCTYDLYRQPSKVWSKLPYDEALKLRKHLAKQAMFYYKGLAEDVDKHTMKYNEDVSLYNDSRAALHWNEKLLEEIQ